MSTRTWWCRRALFLHSGLAAPRAVAARGVCRPEQERVSRCSLTSEGLRATVPSCVVDDEAEQKRLEMELKVAMLSAKEKLCSVPCAR